MAIFYYCWMWTPTQKHKYANKHSICMRKHIPFHPHNIYVQCIYMIVILFLYFTYSFSFMGSSLSDFCHHSQFHSVSNDYRENIFNMLPFKRMSESLYKRASGVHSHCIRFFCATNKMPKFIVCSFAIYNTYSIIFIVIC